MNGQKFKDVGVCVCVILATLFFIMMMQKGLKTKPIIVFVPVKPSHLLGFPPIMEDSDPLQIRQAQAELGRHGIDVGPDGIDGKCGKQTALGILELLCKIEAGYEVRSIMEKRSD